MFHTIVKLRQFLILSHNMGLTYASSSLWFVVPCIILLFLYFSAHVACSLHCFLLLVIQSVTGRTLLVSLTFLKHSLLIFLKYYLQYWHLCNSQFLFCFSCFSCCLHIVCHDRSYTAFLCSLSLMSVLKYSFSQMVFSLRLFKFFKISIFVHSILYLNHQVCNKCGNKN